MNDAAEKIIDAEVTDLTTTKQPSQLIMRQELSPESLIANIERQKAMKKAMTEYVRDEMIKGHHYYSFNEDGKPALTKDGAFSICYLLGVVPGPVDIEISRDGDHFTVISHAHFFKGGIEIASGRGSASTRESKYAYRWVGEKHLPKDVDKATLKTRERFGRNNNSWTEYRLPNDDLGDLENTIIKMSSKRASVDGVMKLPIISDIFAPDDDGGHDAKSAKPKGTPQTRSKTAAKPVEPEPPAVPEIIQKAVDLSYKLQKEFGIEAEDLARQFLPEGVGKFSELSEEQAKEAMPGLADLLNAKMKESKESAA